MAEEVKPQDAPEPQGSEQEAASSTPPDVPQKAGPAQVVGCWIILLVIAALVVGAAFKIGQLIRQAGSPRDTSNEQVEKEGIGDGDLTAGETYKSSIQIQFVSMAPTSPAPEPEDEEAEEEEVAEEPAPKDTTPRATPGEAADAPAEKKDAAQETPPVNPHEGETAWIVSATATNTGDKTVTYLKVQVTLTDESGSDLGGSWVDAATASETGIYARYFGEMPPGKVKKFEARVWVSEDSTPDKVSFEVTACAVK